MLLKELESAWRLREEKFGLSSSSVLRVFHGAGEGDGPTSFFSIDSFKNHFWITAWDHIEAETLNATVEFLKTKGAEAVVYLERPEKDLPSTVQTLYGEPPEKFVVQEGDIKLIIKFKNVRHPGLFLDHQPLRVWLKENSKDLTVLNTFSYTGSLSLAAAAGEAKHVTTLDLSSATIQWAKENWAENNFPPARGDFIYGDYFEWLPKWVRQSRKFDMIILDPPSSSRGKTGHFSTSKDLVKLHELAMQCLNPAGVIVSSINSYKISAEKFEADVMKAAKNLGLRFLPWRRLELPDTFPTPSNRPEEKYLKGIILKHRD